MLFPYNTRMVCASAELSTVFAVFAGDEQKKAFAADKKSASAMSHTKKRRNRYSLGRAEKQKKKEAKEARKAEEEKKAEETESEFSNGNKAEEGKKAEETKSKYRNGNMRRSRTRQQRKEAKKKKEAAEEEMRLSAALEIEPCYVVRL